jgi:hypothetical protein
MTSAFVYDFALGPHPQRLHLAAFGRSASTNVPHIRVKKMPTRLNRVGRVTLDWEDALTVEHNSSDTGDPLSTGPLSGVGETLHDHHSLARRPTCGLTGPSSRAV